jgi:hypothetical protein
VPLRVAPDSQLSVTLTSILRSTTTLAVTLWEPCARCPPMDDAKQCGLG